MFLVDVSNVNGPVDWASVRQAGIQGVWLKATEGVTYNDPTFAGHRERANAAGLRVGAYHFARPDHNNTPGAEARHFAAAVGKLGRRDLRPVLDLEVVSSLHPRELEAWAHKFSQRVTALLGVAPLFYSYPAYIAAMAPQRTIGGGLWLASYGPNDGRQHPVVAPRPWRKWVAQQYASRGRVNGVPGDVDCSYAPRVTPLLAHPVLGRL